MTQLSSFNGVICGAGKAQIPIQSDAVMYGAGLFETMRTYQNKKMPFLDAHLDRIMASLAILNIPCHYHHEQLRTMVLEIAEQHPDELQRIKLVIIPDGVYIESNALVIDNAGDFTLMSYQGQRSMPQHKSTSYLDCYLAWQQAQQAGFSDALLINAHNRVLEASRANIFWVQGDIVSTRKADILPGIIRDFVINHCDLDIQFQNISLDEIYKADEVFVTNSIKGIVPVTRIDDQAFSTTTLTNRISSIFSEFTSQ